MPADVCSAIGMISGTGKVCLKRSASSIYLNAFNSAMMLTFKLNHDLQLLFGTGRCIAFIQEEILQLWLPLIITT